MMAQAKLDREIARHIESMCLINQSSGEILPPYSPRNGDRIDIYRVTVG